MSGNAPRATPAENAAGGALPAVLAGGLLFGAATSIPSHLPWRWLQVPVFSLDSAWAWCWAPVVVGLLLAGHRRRQVAILATAFLWAAALAYVSLDAAFGEYGRAEQFGWWNFMVDALLWGVLAVPTGVVFGVAGSMVRTSPSLMLRVAIVVAVGAWSVWDALNRFRWDPRTDTDPFVLAGHVTALTSVVALTALLACCACRRAPSPDRCR